MLLFKPLSLICPHFPVFLPADVISTVEFNQTGDLLATGDKGGRVVIFQRETEVSLLCNASNNPVSMPSVPIVSNKFILPIFQQQRCVTVLLIALNTYFSHI